VGSMGRELAAVLFDMDGTLVDTEKVWEIALRELAARYGGVLSGEARLAMIGASADRTMELLFADLGLPPEDPTEGADWLDVRMLDLLADGVEWRPGAAELLAAVRAEGVPTALVTNTRRLLVEVLLPVLGPFDVVVSGDEVPRTKPDPAPYRLAAGSLGVDPAASAAIEDSPAGIISARGAGCVVLAVPSEVALVGVDATVVTSLLEVDVDLLRDLVGGAVPIRTR